MSIVDNVPVDPNPLVVTIDLSEYSDGGKLSTLFKQFFETRKVELGLADGAYADYILINMVTRLKQTLLEESRDKTQTLIEIMQTAMVEQQQTAASVDEVNINKL